jgi:hypothetical protein
VPAGTYKLNAAMPKVFAITLLLSVPVVWAQSPVIAHEPGLGHSELDSRFQKQMFERWALDPDADKKILARKQAEAQLREFYTKAHRFVELWRNFAEDLNSQKTFNAKLAKEVSKAFHDLEKSDGWPVGRSK